MRVSAPPPPSSGVRRNDITGIRLARHVAVLFGVDVPENPTGTVWVSDFNKVTVGDIGRGAPKVSKAKAGDIGYLPAKGWYLVDRSLIEGPAGKPQDSSAVTVVRVEGVEEVPSATLNRFKPDTKAAALVAGAQHLFFELEEIFRDTIRVLGTLDDGTQLDDSIRIAVWASLIAEVYRCQPALFTAAVQARLTQRASVSNWQPLVPPEQATNSASSEYGEHTNDDVWQPVHLGILDRVMKDQVRPSFGPGISSKVAAGTESPQDQGLPPASETDSPPESSDPNQDYLTDGMIDRWCRHLTQSTDRGLTWTVQEQQRRSAEIYLSGITPLSRFITEMRLLSPRVLPYGTESSEENWVRFDPTLEDHRRRVRPRIPSRAELGSLPEKSSMAIIHTLMSVHRAIRANASLNHRQMLKEISDDQLAVAELSESLWGSNNPLSAWTKHLWLRGKISAGREQDPEFTNQHWPAFMEGIRHLHHLREQGAISTGEWVDIFSGVSPDLNARARDLSVRGDQPGARALRAEVLRYWKELLALLNLDTGLVQEGPAVSELTFGPSRMTAALLLHNYLGVALRSEDASERLNAVRFGYRVVLPLRRLVAQDRKNDTPSRLSAQIIARAAARLATETDESNRPEMLDLCAVLLKEVLKSQRVTELLSGDRTPAQAADLNVLLSISETALTLYECKTIDIPMTPEQVGLVVGLMGKALAELSGDQAHVAGEETSRARDVHRCEDRWEQLLQKGTP